MSKPAEPLDLDAEVLHGVEDYSNAELIGFVIGRLRDSEPSRVHHLAITQLHQALLWLDGDATDKLP